LYNLHFPETDPFWIGFFICLTGCMNGLRKTVIKFPENREKEIDLCESTN